MAAGRDDESVVVDRYDISQRESFAGPAIRELPRKRGYRACEFAVHERRTSDGIPADSGLTQVLVAGLAN